VAKYQMTQVGKRKLKLSNLDKTLYPELKVIKAEVIEYYWKMAPTLLRHTKRRPLSVIRLPDGINGKHFFQKDKPDWAPDWVESVPLGKTETKDYMLATEEAIFVWLANLACLELHYMQVKHPEYNNPDQFIFDLDPGKGTSFSEIIDIAESLKEFLESYEYHPYVKTSGNKGLHIHVPIFPKWENRIVYQCVKELAKEYIKTHPGTCTLKISKEARKGKLLLDIYRNRHTQTVIAPYSLRANEFAGVSMPLTWAELTMLEDPSNFNIRNVQAKINQDGDAWEGFGSFAVDLHQHRSKPISNKKLAKSDKHKTPEQLEEYQQKRDFSKTPEPAPSSSNQKENTFVIHRHHARRLHYDLRLEENGALRSFAIPKGLPHKPGIKRLAIETEPHPLEYLDFEGEIPKGEYGAGKMWVFANGRYNVTKKKKEGFYFHLSSLQLDGEFRIHNIKNKEWLLERVDRPQIDIFEDEIKVMLADKREVVPEGDQYTFEVKWDGIRATLHIDEGALKIKSRSGRDITKLFPELHDIKTYLNASSGLFDGEIVALDSKGRPEFKNVISRLHQTSEAKIERSTRSNPVYFYMFDCINLDGRFVTNEPLWKRQQWVKDVIKKAGPYRNSEAITDGQSLYAAARQMNLEGIMAKDRNALYQIGKRSKAWYKIKFKDTEDCVILGYVEGKGERKPLFGAMHIGSFVDGELIYRGKVGTGFDMKKLKELKLMMDEIKTDKKGFENNTPDDSISTWLEPILFCEVKFASITPSDTFREPVFVRLRPDLNA